MTLTSMHELGVEVERVYVARLQVRPISDLHVAFRIFAAIIRLRPQLVHAYSLKMMLLTKLVLLPMSFCCSSGKLIVSFAGLGRAFEEKTGLFHALRRGLITFLLNLGAKRLSQQVTVENRADAQRLSAYGLSPDVPISLIRSTGLNFNQFSPGERSGGVSVLFASRPLYSKGASVYLKAVERLAPLYPNAQFGFAGELDSDDPDCISAETIAPALRFPNFKYYGEVPPARMTDLLANTDVVCLPSTYNEGVPRILMEGAASQASFISTLQPGWVDIVGVEPESGWLIPDNSLDALSRALEASLNAPEDTRQKGIRARRILLAAGVSESDVQEGFLAVYKSAFGDANPNALAEGRPTDGAKP